jgi:hypothetical protein
MKSKIEDKSYYVEYAIYSLLVGLCLSSLLLFPLELNIPILVIGLCGFIISFYTAATFFKEIDYFFSFIILSIALYNFTNFPLHSELNEVLYPILTFTFVIIILGWFFRGRIYPKNYIRFKKYSNLDVLFLFIFFVLFSISVVYFNSQDLTTIKGFFKLTTILFGFYFFFSYLPTILLNDDISLLFFLKSLGFLGTITALIGLITVFIEVFPTEYGGTAISFYQHPNATASIYNFSIPVLLFLILKIKNKITKFERSIFFWGLVLNFLGLLFTFSRSSIISVLLVLLIFMYNYSKKALIGIMIVLPVASAVAISDFFTSKGTVTAVGRLGLIATTLEMLNSSKQGALWGFGTISTIPIFNSFKVALGVFDQNNVPHNVFIFYILQFGLISFIPLFIYLMKLFVTSAFKFVRNKADDYLVLSFAVCFPMLVKNMFEDLVFFPEFILFYLFLFFLGVMNISNNRQNVVKI